MIRDGTINPLNVHGLRKLDICPPHFTPVTFDIRTSTKHITDWIYEHLEGRFFVGSHYVHDAHTNNYDLMTVVAFENAAEASYFVLNLDQLNRA